MSDTMDPTAHPGHTGVPWHTPDVRRDRALPLVRMGHLASTQDQTRSMAHPLERAADKTNEGNA